MAYGINDPTRRGGWDPNSGLRQEEYAGNYAGTPAAGDGTGGSMGTSPGFMLGSTSYSPTDAIRLANDPTALLAGLLQGTTGLNPASLGYYADTFEPFSNIYMMNNNFELTPELQAALATGDQEVIAAELAKIESLSGQSMFDEAARYQMMQSTPGSGGIDPAQQLGRFFQSARMPTDGSNMTGYAAYANSGDMQNQVNFVRQGVNAALVNANPYTRNLINALISWLGISYLASSGQGQGGFIDYITRGGQGAPTGSNTAGYQMRPINP